MKDIFVNRYILYLLILLICCTVGIATAQTISVDNTSPKFDANEKIVDAHDGRIVKFGEKFYWYGTSYGNTNGFTSANHYVCYSSPDMITWKKIEKALRTKRYRCICIFQ